MCFFSFLRAGKVVVPSDSAFNPSIHLTVKDISVDSHSSPSYITVKIKASKSNPFRRGVTIYLGQTHNQISPVAATLRYMLERGLSEGPLFVFEDGRLLTRERFVVAVRESLASTGIDTAEYCGHSFGIGAATTAAEWGIQDSFIRMIGRWESLAYLLYISVPQETQFVQWQRHCSGTAM